MTTIPSGLSEQAQKTLSRVEAIHTAYYQCADDPQRVYQHVPALCSLITELVAANAAIEERARRAEWIVCSGMASGVDTLAVLSLRIECAEFLDNADLPTRHGIMCAIVDYLAGRELGLEE